jgi:hypothetical protein
MWFPIPVTDAIHNGTYKLTFSFPEPWLVPSVTVPYVKEIGFGKRIVVSQYDEDDINKILTVTVSLEDVPSSGAPNLGLPGMVTPQSGVVKVPSSVQSATLDAGIPLSYIVAGIVTILGIGIFFLTLQKVEKLIDSPVGGIFVVAVAVLILYVVYRSFKKG